MAQPNYSKHNNSQRLTDNRIDDRRKSTGTYLQPQRPFYRESTASEETIRAVATPPIEIPGSHEDSNDSNDDERSTRDESFMDRYMRTRKTSISFANEINTESGPQHIDEPLEKPASRESRTRSVGEGRHVRSHSESERSHFDPVTGRHLPKYSTSPPREHARVGEARFPLLQTTVDDMARESRQNVPHAMSLTSESTLSPKSDEVTTPRDIEEDDCAISPSPFSPGLRQISSSFDVTRLKHRTASQRWRDGEAAQDFFSRAGSMRKSTKDPIRRSTRRDTASSARSPHSAASSYLKGFSLGSGSDDQGPPPAVDAEGSTIGDDYVLGKQIGFGGFSVIREVTQLSPQTGKQRKLAVKIVRRQLEGKSESENEAAQAEFDHEVELWRLLSHRHILALEAVYKLDEATFCFIPLNVGGTLFDLVRSNRQGLDPELAANYAYQICSALRYLHLDARVVHRDLKLENCLLEEGSGGQGLVRLCDFGMAEWISNDDNQSFSGSDRSASPNGDSSSFNAEEMFGRPLNKFFGPADTSTSAFAGGSLEYAAPEILRIATHPNYDSNSTPSARTLVSPAVDIWALGCCIFTLLMGKRPFADNFQPRIVIAILAGNWDSKSLQQKAGKDVSRVVKSCLQDNAQNRASVLHVMADKWFDLVRGDIEKEDEEAENRSQDGSKGGWRL